MGNVVINPAQVALGLAYNPDAFPNDQDAVLTYTGDDQETKDDVLRAALRVKTWAAKAEYRVETGHIGTDNQFTSESGSDGSKENVSGVAFSVSKELDILTRLLEVTGLQAPLPATGTDSGLGLWLFIDLQTGDYKLSFSLATDFPFTVAGHAGSLAVTTRDDDSLPATLSFFGESWPILSNGNAPGSVYPTGPMQDDGKTPAYRVTIKTLTLKPKTYWTYGGRYATATGGPA